VRPAPEAVSSDVRATAGSSLHRPATRSAATGARGLARARLAGGLVLLVLAVTATGCGSVPRGRFDALAAASKDVEARTVETDADIVRLTRRFMIFSPAPGPYTTRSFVPEIDVDGQKQDFDFGPRLQPREAALGVLSAYTEALAAFAKKDYQGDLDRATQSLGGNVERLIGHVTASGEVKQAAGVLATAVNGLGRAVTERMRRAALRDAMEQAAPGVRAIAAFVTEVNARASAAVTVMRNEMIRKANAFAVGDGVARLQLNEAVEAVIVETGALLGDLGQITKAVAAIPPAHDEVREALDHDERTALAKLKALVAETKRLQKHYSTLK
jgi:hypothetical protein